MKSPETLCVMIDCSRNAVMKPEQVKAFAAKIKKMGYNALMLYTEDTYAVEDEPYFGHMRGRYTAEELKELDRYCLSIGIELIPCIQVLAHLGHLPRWEEYWCHMDCQDVLLVGDERNYLLIQRMFATISKCFTTKRIHIGMDEAFYLGLGRSLEQNGFRDRKMLFVEHLNRVKQIADSYGMHCMLWSDMLFHQTKNSEKISRELLAQFPRDVELVYWEYESKDSRVYDENITAHRQFEHTKTAFAGAVWTCTGYAPNLRLSLEATRAAMQSVRKNEIDTVIMTMWGDDGKDCSYFAGISGLFAAAQMAQGNFDQQQIEAGFQREFGYSFSEFMDLELANITQEGECYKQNPSKYLLFNDPILGLFDYTVHSELKARYEQACRKLEKAVNGREFDYLFDFQAKLVKLLALKCELGLRLRTAYQAGDKKTIRDILREDFPLLHSGIREVYESFRGLWLRENKTLGMELQEHRFGGLMLRTQSCERLLQSYVDGETDKLEELEQPSLPGHADKVGKAESFNSYLQVISACANGY